MSVGVCWGGDLQTDGKHVGRVDPGPEYNAPDGLMGAEKTLESSHQRRCSGLNMNTKAYFIVECFGTVLCASQWAVRDMMMMKWT